MKYIDWLLGIINARSDTLGNVDGKVRYAKPSDLNSIYTLQGLYDELDYPKKGLEIILNNKEAINFVIENKSGEILNYVLGYPSSYYKDTQKDIGWIITAECPELNDNKSFYLELTETRPGYQRKGLYKLSRKIMEITAHDAGFSKLYMHAIHESIESHKSIGSKVTRFMKGYWKNKDNTPLDAYLMENELNEERIKENLKKIIYQKKPQKAYMTIETFTPKSYSTNKNEIEVINLPK